MLCVVSGIWWTLIKRARYRSDSKNARGFTITSWMFANSRVQLESLLYLCCKIVRSKENSAIMTIIFPSCREKLKISPSLINHRFRTSRHLESPDPGLIAIHRHIIPSSAPLLFDSRPPSNRGGRPRQTRARTSCDTLDIRFAWRLHHLLSDGREERDGRRGRSAVYIRHWRDL